MQKEKGRRQKGRRVVARLNRVRVRSVLSFCLLPFAFCIVAAAADGPINPDDPAYLRRQYAWFQAQEPARQQQLRKLHADFTQLAPEDQARLVKVMQAYNAWLARLPETDRQRVLAAPTAAERLEEVKRLREREWVESLPKPYRDEYAALDADARRQKVQEWRAEEAERREEWALAQKHWAEPTPGKPQIFQKENQAALEAFAAHLAENLSEDERRQLDEAKSQAEAAAYFAYPYQLVRLADLHPIFPWSTVGPKTLRELPADVKQHLPKPMELPREVRQAQGRWPEFAVEITAYCKKHDIQVPPLGDARKDQMPPEVVQVLKNLEPQLRRSGEVGKAELRALEEAEGKWPDYPRAIMDLARKYKLAVPGWTLPGSPQFWDRLRAAKPKR